MLCELRDSWGPITESINAVKRGARRVMLVMVMVVVMGMGSTMRCGYGSYLHGRGVAAYCMLHQPRRETDNSIVEPGVTL